MQTILLDTNAYHELQVDKTTRRPLAAMVSQGSVRVIATTTVIDELRAGPFGGLPEWFPIEPEPESVFVLDHSRLGRERLGAGQVYADHLGASIKRADAILADSSDDLADIAVSNDRRFVRRLNASSVRCRAMPYDEFRSWLQAEENRAAP